LPGRPDAPVKRTELDTNFAIAIDENYWKERLGVARLTWSGHELVQDERLRRLVPTKSVTFRGPMTWVSGAKKEDIAWLMTPEGWKKDPLPGAVCRRVGKGRVVYLASAIDAALWSYAYPYQRRLLALALSWAAAKPPPVQVIAPMCVQAAFYHQGPKRLIIHLFNNICTTAHHGLPASEVPLREETVPIHGIRIRFDRDMPKRCRLEPEGLRLKISREGASSVVVVPKLDLHSMVVTER
jgi:hypothetical protein